MIKNPVIKGFNPDPSAVNVDGVIYIATSTFNWAQTVRIYKTNNLKDYELVGDAINLDLSGSPLDTAIWAPNLTYHDGLFYLVYTVVTSTRRPFKDMKNYVITTKNIDGPWSDPIYLNSNGFDPSFFHHDDKLYLLQTEWDYRLQTPNKSSGIIMQELDPKSFESLTEWVKIFSGTDAKKTEAPNLYFVNGYYYLFTAEGGTGRTHQVTVCRSKNVWGEYEVSKYHPLITASHNDEHYLQCAGHASLVEFNKRYFIYFLTKRQDGKLDSLVGRETSLAEVYFTTDGWIRLINDGLLPPTVVNISNHPLRQDENHFKTTFKGVSNEFQMPFKYDSTYLEQIEGGLKIFGGASIQSTFDLALMGYRITDIDFVIKTKLTYEPNNFQQMAGVSLYLNHENYIFLYITNEKGSKVARVMKKANGKSHLYKEVVKINCMDSISLSIEKVGNKTHFKVNEQKFKTAVNPMFLNTSFTGLMAGLSVHDLIKYKKSSAIFNQFEYIGKKEG